MNKLIQQAFTLIELLVVIAIIGILSGLIVVSMSGATDKANLAKIQVFSNSLRNSLMSDIASEWKLDETLGSTTFNSWGGNNASLINFDFNTADGWRSESQCIIGGCLQFDGTNDYVNTLKVFGGDGSGTVEFWGNVSAITGDAMRYITFGNAGSDYFGLYLDANSDLSVKYYDGGHRYFPTSKIIDLNAWHYIVAIWVENQYMDVYVDGIRVLNNTTILGTSTFGSNASGTVRFGCPANELTSHGYYKGLIDNVRIYKAAAKISKIKEQYFAGLNNLLINGGITKEDYLSRLNNYASNN